MIQLSRNILLQLLALLLVFVASAACLAQQNKSTWETLTCEGAPSARHENSFVEVGGKLYLLGGRGIKPVDIFDPERKSWSKGQEPPVEVHHFQAVAYAGKIYIVGAMTGAYPREKPLERILIYNPGADAWEWGATIPADRRRGSAGVVVAGDKAIVVSGIIDGHWEGHVPWVDSYDFKTGEWSKLPDAPRPRDHFHAAIKNGIIYCAGGRNSSTKTGETFTLTIPEVDVYDTRKKRWSTLPAANNIPTQRAGASSIFLKNDLLLIGGESAAQTTAHNEVEAYNIKEKTWRKLPPLNTGRHGTQAIYYKNAVFLAAGCGNRGGKPELDSVEKMTDRK
ncbi:Kelch repeat-containing protein [Botryobacter ruber]|uniref:Kelch repeat-containing protein n=1 Tax=Botryobacter ruber TaxID=2171629 RepID=UPI000E0B3089|nr:kelch repeat-containing protein [Botryobacter ruber]